MVAAKAQFRRVKGYWERKGCQNRASRISNEVRRAAIAHLIATHATEYRDQLAAERAARTPRLEGHAGDAA